MIGGGGLGEGGITVSHWEGEGRDVIKRVEMSFQPMQGDWDTGSLEKGCMMDQTRTDGPDWSSTQPSSLMNSKHTCYIMKATVVS